MFKFFKLFSTTYRLFCHSKFLTL